ncbi:Hypothetical protein EIN_271910, partial [Entamoeba invadens IP1]
MIFLLVVAVIATNTE